MDDKEIGELIFAGVMLISGIMTAVFLWRAEWAHAAASAFVCLCSRWIVSR